jgi:hypothetical protein
MGSVRAEGSMASVRAREIWVCRTVLTHSAWWWRWDDGRCAATWAMARGDGPPTPRSILLDGGGRGSWGGGAYVVVGRWRCKGSTRRSTCPKAQEEAPIRWGLHLDASRKCIKGVAEVGGQELPIRTAGTAGHC